MTTTTTLRRHALASDVDAATRHLIANYLGENELHVTTVATGADMEKLLAGPAVGIREVLSGPLLRNYIAGCLGRVLRSRSRREVPRS